MADTHKFIAKAIHHVGGLHKMLGIPQGQTIPLAKIEAAAQSKNTLLRKRAQFALTLHRMPHAKPVKVKGQIRG